MEEEIITLDGWREGYLKDIANILMGQSPKGDTCNSFKNGLPLLNGPTEFTDNHPIPTQFTIDPKKIAQKGDLLFCVRGSTTGKMNWADQQYAIGRGIAALKHKKGDEYQSYLRAVVEYKLSKLLISATGSTFPNISRDQLLLMEILLPPLPEQKAIASVLSSLDDKIELLREQNKTLEALAQTLFKRWFVDFNFPDENGEPYKDSGGKMIESELGEIPEGWRVYELGEISKLIAGGDRPKNTTINKTETNCIPVYSNGISNDGLYGYTDKPKINEESVTVSARGTIGYICLRLEPYVPIVRLISIIPIKNYLSTKYLFLWLKNQNISSTGTTQQQLTIPDFSTSKIIISECIVMDKFTILLDSLYKKISSNNFQIQTLSILRDTLLPKLMKGEVRVW
ncbi:MAG: restriction endonuclease subunit S [SAR324 cluster bacterium]|nr:restriction endonuclease subunit S [SAR324 cluster bacterium]